MIRIPCPIPEPDRTWLILAGREACRLNHHREAQEAVQEIIDGIVRKYGIEEEDDERA